MGAGRLGSIEKMNPLAGERSLQMKRYLEYMAFIAVLLCGAMAWAGGSVTPVGGYLYANEAKLEDAKGSLEIHFTTPSAKRMVVALGRKYRKSTASRDGTTEAQREHFKPRLARMSQNGTVAKFSKMTPDYYDIVVIESDDMMLYDGLLLHDEFSSEEKISAEKLKEFTAQIAKSLGIGHGLIGRWEQFFDEKRIERVQPVGRQAGVFLQQMRLGVALAESGAKLNGCIHSIDMVWVEQTTDAEHTWQVINRQQLYRDEISSRSFFTYRYVEALHGIRVGTRAKVLQEPIALPKGEW